MRVSVFSARVRGLSDLLRHGSGHPVFGAFLDAGSYGRVKGAGSGRQALEYLLAEELDDSAGSMGISVLRVSQAPMSHELGEDVIVVVGAPTLVGTPGVEDSAWHEAMALGDAVALVIADEADGIAPAWVIAGNGLPSAGAVEPCERSDLWGTWFTLANGTPAAGRFLLGEPVWLPEDEERSLTRRLRELYGE